MPGAQGLEMRCGIEVAEALSAAQVPANTPRFFRKILKHALSPGGLALGQASDTLPL
jgi:hypothetical protein